MMLLCLPLGLRGRQHRVSLLCMLLAAFALCCGSIGCGGSSGSGTPASGGGGLANPGTTLGNYTVTVSGTFAGTATSTSFTLTVN
jgi:hypothetical protein